MVIGLVGIARNFEILVVCRHRGGRIAVLPPDSVMLPDDAGISIGGVLWRPTQNQGNSI